MNNETAFFKCTVIMDYLSEPDFPLHGATGRAKTDGDHPMTVEAKFTGHGDANPKNVGSQVKDALFRMAETRSIVRALRWAVNSGTAAAEELTNEEADEIAGMRGAASPPRGNGANDTPEERRSDSRGKAFRDMKINEARATESQSGYLKGLMKQCNINREVLEDLYGPVEDMPVSMANDTIDALTAYKDDKPPKKKSALEWILQWEGE
jgi:hypothetical protein